MNTYSYLTLMNQNKAGIVTLQLHSDICQSANTLIGLCTHFQTKLHFFFVTENVLAHPYNQHSHNSVKLENKLTNVVHVEDHHHHPWHIHSFQWRTPWSSWWEWTPRRGRRWCYGPWTRSFWAPLQKLPSTCFHVKNQAFSAILLEVIFVSKYLHMAFFLRSPSQLAAAAE